MKPHHLPSTCPSCSAPIETYTWRGQHAYGWQMETVEYKCFAFSGGILESTGTDKPYVRRECPKSAKAKAAVERADSIDRSVARALRSVEATHEECVAFCKRMSSDSYSIHGGRGIWTMLPKKEENP